MKHGGRFVVDNKELYMVRICGRIVSTDQNENHTNFTLHDGTGEIDGRIWPKTINGKTELSGASVSAYYLVIGNVVSNGSGILLQTLKAEQVKDHSQITMHLLTAIHEHYAAKALTRPEVERWGVAAEDAKLTVNKTLKLELDKEAVVSFLSRDSIRSTMDGASSDCIMKELHLEYEEGWNTLIAMIDEGSIYNTIDYQHFKLADEN